MSLALKIGKETVRYRVLVSLQRDDFGLTARELADTIGVLPTQVHRELTIMRRFNLIEGMDCFPRRWKITEYGEYELSMLRAQWEKVGRTHQGNERLVPKPPPAKSMYAQAVELCNRYERASVSFLQRRLRIGYTRAAELIERMVYEGALGPNVQVKGVSE